jgi:hypothetical protein
VKVVHVWHGHATTSDNIVAVPRDKRISAHGRGSWRTVLERGIRTQS